MGLPMTTEMRARWRWHQHVAQSDNAPNSDYRPNAKVMVARGHFFVHPFPPYPRELVPEQRQKSKGKRIRGDWDEKYIKQHGQRFRRTPNGPLYRSEEAEGMIDLPYIKKISIKDDVSQNGIATATVTLSNQEWETFTDARMGFYRLLKQGFFSPFYGGESFGTTMDSIDKINRAWDGENADDPVLNDDGKLITGLLLPDRHIDVFQGYGDEVQRTFTGLIDNVQINAKTAEITLQCTNFGKILTEAMFFSDSELISQVMPHAKPYPVAFGDAKYWRKQGGRKSWPDKGAPKNMILVNDITDIVGHILGWAGFQYFKSPRPGRIGSTGVEEGGKKHDAVFGPGDDAFDKGSPMIDGITRIKDLLGYHLYITPEFWSKRPLSGRFRDPDVYDAEYSRYTIGLPHFVPSNIWQKEAYVEQFSDNDILIDGSITYDSASVMKNMYVVNSGVKKKNGRPMKLGAAGPWGLDRGLGRHIMVDLKEEMGIQMSQKEVMIFIWMTMIQSVIQYCRGQFTIPGYPGAKINDQCDVKETSTGTWRRFFITGYESDMTLGANATYKTTMTVVNMDNVYIRNLKRKIREIGGWKAALGFQGGIRETARPS